MTQVGPWDGERLVMRELETPTARSSGGTGPGSGELVLASWKQLIDDGRMQDGDEAMRATARKPVVLVGSVTLAALGVSVGDVVTLSGPRGSVDLPIGVADLAEGAVWAPASAPGVSVRHLVGPAGCAVTITGGSR
jgi:NADH-quinone oxidoreductase subunit G